MNMSSSLFSDSFDLFRKEKNDSKKGKDLQITYHFTPHQSYTRCLTNHFLGCPWSATDPLPFLFLQSVWIPIEIAKM
uniref:Ovule protein n=1 Tax=Caenorhabditis tropicalis TaxID=1561998 RepID=A0A1I7TIK1_9PELO